MELALAQCEAGYVDGAYLTARRAISIGEEQPMYFPRTLRSHELQVRVLVLLPGDEKKHCGN